MGTAAELRSEARRLRQEAEAHERQAQALRAAADARDAMAAELESLDASLRRARHKSTVSTADMEAVPTPSRGAAIGAAKTKRRIPFRRALEAFGLSLPEYARRKGWDANAVTSWTKDPKHGGRRIPQARADEIARDFVDATTGASMVPATDESWPSGIRR